MVRVRLACLTCAFGLGLLAGCSSISQHPWFSWGRRNKDCETAVGCDMDMPYGVGGPAIMDAGPMLSPPPGTYNPYPATGQPRTLAPQTTEPPTLAPPRAAPASK